MPSFAGPDYYTKYTLHPRSSLSKLLWESEIGGKESGPAKLGIHTVLSISIDYVGSFAAKDSCLGYPPQCPALLGKTVAFCFA